MTLALLSIGGIIGPSKSVKEPMTSTSMSFLDEIAEFRRLMGCKSFWELTEAQHSGALHGLLCAYLTAPADEVEKCSTAFISAIDEYHRRYDYMTNRPIGSLKS